MNWKIQTDVFEENQEGLVREIRKQGHNCDLIKYSPYERTELGSSNGPTIFYGSLNMAGQVIRETNWFPGVFYTSDRYNCDDYYPKLYPYLLNQDCMFLPYGLLKNKDLFKHLIRDDHVFIRPNSGGKSFTGQVVPIDKWENTLRKLNAYSCFDNELVVLSSPANIKREWRLFVSDRVITGSQYKVNGKHEESEDLPEEVISYANSLITETGFRPDPVYTLDICESKDLHVLEVNCFSCSGMYKSDKEKIVKEVSKEVTNEYESVYG